MTDANDAAKRLREDIRQGCVGGQIAEDWLAVLDSLEAAEKERDALREELESARRVETLAWIMSEPHAGPITAAESRDLFQKRRLAYLDARYEHLARFGGPL